MNDRTNHTLHKRARCVASVEMPTNWDSARDFLDIWRAGSGKNGYTYGLTTFSGGTFRFLWLTDEERIRVIEALGGTA